MEGGMKRAAIVITSIFPPTRSIDLFAEKESYSLIVVGDKKTPKDWRHEGAEYLSTQLQESSGYNICRSLPYNHYCRKMTGYLHAVANGVEYIIDTDDDNLPKGNWGFPPFTGTYSTVRSTGSFINIYGYFTKQKIWPRGFPLRYIAQSNHDDAKLTDKPCKIGVWQGLTDKDPDVDAIYRLVDDTPCIFQSRAPIVLETGLACPFNSQNTAFKKELFPLLYLPAHVTFRFTDILRGLVAQPIMWVHGYNMGFTEATVVQERNSHDYFEDFISEVPMYLHSESIIEIVSGVVKSKCDLCENLYNAYDALEKAKIVTANELELLSAWLNDCQDIHQGQTSR